MKRSIDISIIIPTFDKPHYLSLTLAGLARQTLDPSMFEVIVVNDGIESVTDVVERIMRLNPHLQVAVIESSAKGNRSAARNSGIKASTGTVCLFLDDDIILNDRYLDHLRASIVTRYQVVKGDCRYQVLTVPYDLNERELSDLLHSGKPRLMQIASQGYDNRSAVPLLTPDDVYYDIGKLREVSFYPSARRSTYDHIELAFGNVNSDDLQMKWLLSSTNNVAYTRDLLDVIGEFDEHFSGYGPEDLELGYRAYLYGTSFTFSYNAISYHQNHAKRLREQLISSLVNWQYFRTKHNSIEVWLWFPWRVLGDLDIMSYSNLVRGYNRGELSAVRRVHLLKEDLERLDTAKLLRKFGLETA